MSSTQAPVSSNSRTSAAFPVLEGPNHFNRIIRAFDIGGIHPPGGALEFEFTTEEEGISCRHRVEIGTVPSPAWAESAIWRHNGHIAQPRLNGERTSRKAIRQMLEDAIS